MPLLGSLLVSLFGTLGAFFTQYVSKKVALWLACGVAITAAFGVLTLAAYALINGLMTAAPDTVGVALTWLVPPQLPALVGARFALQVAIAVYQYQLNLQLAIASS